MPIHITLPSGDVQEYAKPPTLQAIAESVGKGLARDAVAGAVGPQLRDLCDTVEADTEVRILTARDPQGLDVVRHSCAHLLGHAIKQLYPDTQMAIGPVIEDGFYYDLASDHRFTEQDLARIEQRMHELAAENYEVIKETLPRAQAIKLFQQRGETYKLRLIEDMPAEETFQVYHHQEYVDMCRGPHVPNMRHIKALKLMKLAGAYWRGDARNEMLQRIYGTCWRTQKELDDYLHRLEEAEKRDHRKLGKQLGLFHSQEEAPGMVFWHPRGTTIYLLLEDFVRQAMCDADYAEIKTPQILARELWEKSGHWDKFREMMFTTGNEGREYAIKPMNCPGHLQVFKQGLHSYRDLPLRYAEFGNVHRAEPSGTLHGLLRARNFTQDDAHIFLTEEQVRDEVLRSLKLILKIYRQLGFDKVLLKLSTRPKNRVGDDVMWDKGEQALTDALNLGDYDWELLPGEGAFYGPKIEFSLKDQIGRVWQCGTIQVDFSMPERLGAEYVAADGSRKVPVMIHQAVLGSMERFIGIMIEHHAGKLPFRFVPLQLVVMNITDDQADYARKTAEFLRARGFRVQSDLRNEKIGYKIREQTMQKIPYLIIVGNKEMQSNKLAVRQLDGTDLGVMRAEELIVKLRRHVMDLVEEDQLGSDLSENAAVVD